jgi:hypothetical protein
MLPQTQTKPFLIGAEWQDGASQAVKDLYWETGCNFARVTGGGYGWAVDAHKHALKELGDHGVRVLLQLGSHYPDAKYFDMKDAYFVDQNGKTGVPSRQSWAVEYDGSAWPQYSYASERFKSGIAGDFTAYFKSLGNLDDVEAIMVHNEPGFHWLDKRIFDYNPSSINRFREWLPTQYASIGALNKAWGSSFSSFGTVEPPHDFPTAPNFASWLDWRKSNDEVIGSFLDWERSVSLKLNPKLPVTTNLSGPIDNWYPIRLGDNYRFTQNMDIASIDIYPGSEWTSKFFAGYGMDMTRGAANGKPVYVAECESYAPEHFPQLSDEQRASRLACDLWTYIGHGTNAISVWTLNGQDGFKLTSGEYNDRLRTLREVAYTSKMLDLGAFRKTPRKVAMVVDRSSYLLSGPTENPRAWADRTSRIALSFYGALTQAHIETDVITSEMVRSGISSHYNALILAGVNTMDPVLAANVMKFAEDGGLVIADESIASVDQWGGACYTQPGFDLDRFFGAKFIPIGPNSGTPIPIGKIAFRTPDRFQLAVKEGRQLEGYEFWPTAILHPVGKGNAILVKTNEKFANSEDQNPGFGQAIGKWLKSYAGISPEVDVTRADETIDADRLIDGNGNVLEVITCPQNKALPQAPSQRLSVKFPKMAGKSQSFMVSPLTKVEGTSSFGPVLIPGSILEMTNLESHAVVLTARDHGPLIATFALRSWRPHSTVAISTIVYNPSPRPFNGTLSLPVPRNWVAGKSVEVKLAPFGEKRLTLLATSGDATKRVVLKAVLSTGKGKVDGVPVDVEIR